MAEIPHGERLLAPIESDESRTAAELAQHYAVERELAGQLRGAAREDRSRLYAALYDELFRRVPLHPQLTRKASPAAAAARAEGELRFLRPYLRPAATYLEVGAGDCATARAVAPLVRQVYAVDVSATIAGAETFPDNFALAISDGCSIPVDDGGVDVAYSNQLMEHLHPDDAWEQLRNIHRALAPGGVYLCITPNRLTGPHDISKYFTPVASGFHLREYTHGELARLFREVGFSSVRKYIGVRGRYVRLPLLPIAAGEWLLDRLPRAWSHRLACLRPVALVLNIRLVAVK